MRTPRQRRGEKRITAETQRGKSGTGEQTAEPGTWNTEPGEEKRTLRVLWLAGAAIRRRLWRL